MSAPQVEVIENPVPIKHAGGRPAKYTSVEDLQKAIDDYFDYCDNRIQQVYDKKTGTVLEIINPEPYTVSGLAYAIGMQRETLLQYAKLSQFSDAIKRARSRVHYDVERRLLEGAGVGAIFSLKNNFGWKDAVEVKVDAEITTSHNIDPKFVANFNEFMRQKSLADGEQSQE